MIRDHHDERERRTIIIERLEGSFGFTLQSYSIHYCKEKDVEIITYVDFVDPSGPAMKAGLRSGDVILSINGQDVERADHRTLVSIVQSCPSRMRIVVVFENCVRKVELHMRFIQLQQELQKKISKYNELCAREKNLLSRYGFRRETSFQTPIVVPNIRENPRESVVHPKHLQQQAIAPSSIDTSDREPYRRPSYSCVGTECNCNCLRDLYNPKRSPKVEKPLVQQQRPKTCHFTSCYPSPSHRSLTGNDAERKERTARAYGGYGFGYSYQSEQSSSLKCYKRRNDYEYQQPTKLADPPYYRKSLPKSAEDLLTAQFFDKCQISYATQHYTKVIEAKESLYSQRQPSSVDSLLETSDSFQRYPQGSGAAGFRVQKMTDYQDFNQPNYDEPRSSRTLPLLKRHR